MFDRDKDQDQVDEFGRPRAFDSTGLSETALERLVRFTTIAFVKSDDDD